MKRSGKGRRSPSNKEDRIAVVLPLGHATFNLSPNAAYNAALYLALSDASKIRCKPTKFAQSVRFAAIIRRDHGLEAFEDFLKEMKL
ncbi:MAG: hypothetical protein HYT94_00140 [Parcubacteria group bacterium]|nr:hypothetical protein [Parcubacteria group bacterium]